MRSESKMKFVGGQTFLPKSKAQFHKSSLCGQLERFLNPNALHDDFTQHSLQLVEKFSRFAIGNGRSTQHTKIARNEKKSEINMEFGYS